MGEHGVGVEVGEGAGGQGAGLEGELGPAQRLPQSRRNWVTAWRSSQIWWEL